MKTTHLLKAQQLGCKIRYLFHKMCSCILASVLVLYFDQGSACLAPKRRSMYSTISKVLIAKKIFTQNIDW